QSGLEMSRVQCPSFFPLGQVFTVDLHGAEFRCYVPNPYQNEMSATSIMLMTQSWLMSVGPMAWPKLDATKAMSRMSTLPSPFKSARGFQLGPPATVP